jgi:hypothetical protein
LLKAIAPASEAGKAVKAIDDARKAAVEPANVWVKATKAYADSLIKPLEDALQSRRIDVTNFKIAEQKRQDQARAEQQAKLKRLQDMAEAITTTWQKQTDKVTDCKDLEALKAMQLATEGFKLKCPAAWSDLEAQYLVEAERQFEAVKKYLADRIVSWCDDEPQPLPPVVTTATTTQAQLAVLVEAEPEQVNKGLRTVYKAFVPDWRQVDAVGLLAVIIANPVGKAKLEEIVANYVKHPAQILGIEYKEEQKVTARA